MAGNVGPLKMALPFVQHYFDRHGKPRFYFRTKGRRLIALPHPESPEFAAAYEAALRERERIENG